MGRWKSDLVIRYSCGRTTVGITNETISALQSMDQTGPPSGQGVPGSSGDRPPAAVVAPVATVAAVHAEGIDRAVSALESSAADVVAANAGPGAPLLRYIVNGTTGVLHAISHASRTRCGNDISRWRYMEYDDVTEAIGESSPEFICKRCLPHEREQAEIRCNQLMVSSDEEVVE